MLKPEVPKVKWLNGNTANMKWIADLYQIDFIQEFDNIHLRNYDTEWWSKADKNDLLTIIHQQHKLLSKLEFLFRDAGENATIEDHYMAKQSAQHWKTLQNFLKKNPVMQEQWDNFLMAMKLTQD